jgi:hypothetical protein
MFEVCEPVETLSTMMPPVAPLANGNKAVALALLLVPCAVKNVVAGGHVPPELMAGFAAFVTLIPIRQPLPPVLALTPVRQLLVVGIGEALAAKFPMLKNIQSPDADEEPVLSISVTGEHDVLLIEFIRRGVPTLFKTPAEVKLS